MANSLASVDERPVQAGGRAGLARTLRALARDFGAHRVIAGRRRHGSQGPAIDILTSDWPYDAVVQFGTATIARCLEAVGCAAPGQAAIVQTIDDVDDDVPIYAVAHRYELYGGEFAIVYTARRPSDFQRDRAVTVQMRALYALADHAAAPAIDPASVLTHRERDCLKWVAEGKTTDEVALILGVSSNTVNNYIAHAIPKVAATNRAMAVANAIRSGMI